jgi:hypothetical protein
MIVRFDEKRWKPTSADPERNRLAGKFDWAVGKRIARPFDGRRYNVPHSIGQRAYLVDELRIRRDLEGARDVRLEAKRRQMRPTIV